ncbi:MAG: DUF4412 domain-containing protein [Candidatus Obscuribacterales bacterium]|jgi:hypothetical protein
MKLLASLALAVISTMSATMVQAADSKGELYPKVYDANYVCVSPAGKTEMRLTSDGKGKLRSESKAATYKVVSISDYPGKVCYSIMDAQKMITKMPLKQGYEGNMDAETAKKKNAKDLGVKSIDGRSCHGWSYKENGAESEVWVDNNAQVLVKSITKASGTTTTMQLTKISTAAPAAELFVIPSGYKVMSIN